MRPPIPRCPVLLLAWALVAAPAPSHADPVPWTCARARADWTCRAAQAPLRLAEAGLPAASRAAPDPPPPAACRAAPPVCLLCRWHPVRRALAPVSGSPGTTHLSADRVEVTEQDRYRLRGNVVIRRDGQELTAERARFNRSDDTAAAAGDVLFSDGGFEVSGPTARMNLKADTGRVDDARYVLVDRHAHGTARTLELTGRNRARARDITYTTCDPGHADWLLKARRLRIDRETGTGVAHDASLWLGGLPVFYFPYLRFPIDDRRKSGFLIPKVGVSSRSGFELETPYYFNLAPDRDATFSPRLMTRRGVLLGGQFRYLNPTNHGELDAEYLPWDAVAHRQRGALSFTHAASPAPRWSANVDVNYASDANYFADFGSGLTQASTTFLNRSANLSYHGDHWSLFSQVQDFQTVDPSLPAASRPYARLPQIVLDAGQPFGALGLDYGARAEFDYFQRSNSVDGARLDLKPAVSLPLQGRAYFFTPKVALRYTAYRLSNTAPGADTRPARTTPIASLDTGIYLDRRTRWFGTDYLQTLEPRLYYLYVPYRDQSDIPVFDTGALDFNFSQLFQDNRFAGADRQGDANQLTTALITRFLDPVSGTEPLDAMIGQIFYFQDRRVTLPGVPVGTQSTSDIVGRVSATWRRNWTFTTGLLWDPQQHRTDRAEARLGYTGTGGRLFSVAYRFRRGVLEQTDLSALWPLSARWSVFGRWYQSLRDHVLLEGLVGAQYESCCWTLRAVARRYVSTISGAPNTSLMLQLELKGLGRIGNRVDALMKRDILGYRSETGGW